jgi:hypothetical protein
MQVNNPNPPSINPRILLADSDRRGLADLLHSTGYAIQEDPLRDLPPCFAELPAVVDRRAALGR